MIISSKLGFFRLVYFFGYVLFRYVVLLNNELLLPNLTSHPDMRQPSYVELILILEDGVFKDVRLVRRPSDWFFRNHSLFFPDVKINIFSSGGI